METVTEHAQVHAETARRLRGNRQRHTPGRQQLVDALLEQGRPATITELLDGDVSQSQSSLYRNLSVLEQAGVVRRLTSVDDVARWELAEELTHHHHHLVCNRCGRIEDITLSESLEQALHRVVSTDEVTHGYTVESHTLELVGACPDCA